MKKLLQIKIKHGIFNPYFASFFLSTCAFNIAYGASILLKQL